MKNTSIVIEDFEEYILSIQRFLAKKTFSSIYSVDKKEQIFNNLSPAIVFGENVEVILGKDQF